MCGAAAAAAADGALHLGLQTRGLTFCRHAHHCSAARSPSQCLHRCPRLSPHRPPIPRPAAKGIKLYMSGVLLQTESASSCTSRCCCPLGRAQLPGASQMAVSAKTSMPMRHAGPPHRLPHFQGSRREEARRQEQRPCGVTGGHPVAAASALPLQRCRVHHRPPRPQTTTWQPWVPAAAVEALPVGRDPLAYICTLESMTG